MVYNVKEDKVPDRVVPGSQCPVPCSWIRSTYVHGDCIAARKLLFLPQEFHLKGPLSAPGAAVRPLEGAGRARRISRNRRMDKGKLK